MPSRRPRLGPHIQHQSGVNEVQRARLQRAANYVGADQFQPRQLLAEPFARDFQVGRLTSMPTTRSPLARRQDASNPLPVVQPSTARQRGWYSAISSRKNVAQKLELPDCRVAHVPFVVRRRDGQPGIGLGVLRVQHDLPDKSVLGVFPRGSRVRTATAQVGHHRAGHHRRS